MTYIQEITPDFLRRYFLAFGEKHNPGGVHGAYRTLRAFFQWLMKEEVMAPDWKNPMLKVKAPKVVLDPLEPISIQDVRALINTFQRGDFIGERDRAIFLFLLDTGARAREVCNMNVKDIDLITGAVMIRYEKGGKTRMVFIERKTRRVIRSYLRIRREKSPAVKFGFILRYIVIYNSTCPEITRKWISPLSQAASYNLAAEALLR